MKNLKRLKRLGIFHLPSTSMSLILASSVALTACGGSPSPTLEPEASVVFVALSKEALEQSDSNATPLLEFLVSTDKAVLYDAGVTVSFDTINTGVGTGFATGGAKCGDLVGGEKVDYSTETKSQTVIKKGDSSVAIKIRVCPDADFEPNETLNVRWSSGSRSGTSRGTIINDDAGGLNGTGSAAVLTGLTAFGRDTHALTNDSADGALGFAFDKSGACAVDKVTGLSWQTLPALSKTYADLADYVTLVNGQVLCGHTDWRVPTANELLNLMDISKTTGITANADYLGVAADAMAGQFWSSDVRAASSTVDAWMVDADSNGVISYGGKTRAGNVRLVRGGQPVNTACDNSDSRFAGHPDGTVSDARTGLMWKSCPEGLSGNTCTGTVLSFGSVAAVVTQLGKANSTADNGYSDWRVPTRNELASLVNWACQNPSIVATVFPANESKAYITSSPSVNASTTQVWSVDFTDGNVGIDLLSRNYYLRLVRAGQ